MTGRSKHNRLKKNCYYGLASAYLNGSLAVHTRNSST